MLVALGVLAAGFIVLLVAPFYRRRAERLAISEVKRHLPMSDAEIRADKDRLRAEYAIRIHQLESRVDDAGHQAARQKIELNRRDGMISGLESEIATLKSSLEEHENARRVLEQTITDRLPKVEQRLSQASELLRDRDEEIERLTRATDQTSRALDEARQINTQQRDELLKSNAALASRAARNRDHLADPRFDGEVALRAEVEALRARAREQAEMIARLQGLLVRGGKSAEGKANGEDGAVDAAGASEQDAEIVRLKVRLAETESSLKMAETSAVAGKVDHQKFDDELRSLKSKNDALNAAVARLKASLSIYETAQKDENAIKDSKVAMKARLSALEAEAATHQETIQSLRAEVAAANERLARQAAHYRDELRRLGAGTVPVSAEPRSVIDSASGRRPSLAERMGAPKPVSLKPVPGAGSEDSKASGFLKALSGRGSSESGSGEGVVTLAGLASAAEATVAESSRTEAQKSDNGAAEHRSASDAAKQPRRSGLLDRISGVQKTSS